MILSIAHAPSITSVHWIETQVIDCLLETSQIHLVHISKNCPILREFFGQRRYSMVEFHHEDWVEHGLGAIPRRNYVMVSGSDLFVGLADARQYGKNRSVENMVAVAARCKVNVSIRYYKGN